MTSQIGIGSKSGFFQEVDGLKVQEVQQYLAESNKPFEQSELYVAAEKRNIVDSSLRKSKFRKFTDKKLFDLVQPFVTRLSEEDPLLQYTLRRNDVTHIKYEKGGFFGKHTDYLSVSSNLLEEFSFLVCVTPEAHVKRNQGGKTVIHMHCSSHTSHATTIPGAGISFRKDLEHEGTVLEDGEKHIIMLNLWGTRKDSGGFLQVHFELSTHAEPYHVHNEDALRQLACDRTYLLPIVEAKRSPRLAEHIQSFENSTEGKVIQYACRDCDYEAFKTVFHILRRMYVSSEEVQAHAEVITSYGLDKEHILVAAPEPTAGEGSLIETTLVTENGNSQHEISIYLMDGSHHCVFVAGTDSIKSVKNELKRKVGLSGIALFPSDSEHPLKDSDTVAGCGFPQELFTVKKMTKTDEYEVLGLTGDELLDIHHPMPSSTALTDTLCADTHGSDVILCESLERTKVVAKAAIEAGLPYVSFQILFIEGELVIRGDTCRPCNHTFSMDPAFISVGDCQHVLGWGRVNEDWDGSCRWWEDEEDSREHPQNPALFNLRRILKPNTHITDVIQNVFDQSVKEADYDDNDDDDEHSERDYDDDKIMSLTDPVNNTEASSADDGPFFHVNSRGETEFNAQQATAASSHLKDILFVDQVKDRLKKVPWQFPQESGERSETLCNEVVYGHTVIILVSGVVRMSNLDLDESSKQEYHDYLRSLYVEKTPTTKDARE
eukprot:gnl/MRDRNA2_/MRDRNA2_91815_c0_seq1.p1 gnl/MRDRNA2_/MRDRNA2_91815_c0~~gnl/MRDRNA2_/MRDRNA2_91815_c0_seq1.p1  ORF type:complete len:747 (+),score=125.40 gnl/MRDRNA2_/MRDRNA2_91815_c0_seq1:90-2243(+)